MTDGSRRDCSAGNVIVGSLDCYDYDEDADTDVAFSLAAGYEFGAYSIALAYSDDGEASEIMLGGTAAIDAFKVKGFYADYDDRGIGGIGDVDFGTGTTYDKSYGLSAEYAMANGVGLQALWITRELDLGAGVDAEDSYDAYGVGASYDLGGGATLAGAIIKNELFTDNETRADMGIKFSF